MKRFMLFVLIGCLLGISQPAKAQNTQNFTISSFNGYYKLSKDERNISQLETDEYIAAQFPNFDQNHGIIRALPQTYNGNELGIKIVRVDKRADPSSPSASTWVFSSSEDNGNLLLKIGDANFYVQGTQFFHINYTSKNVTRNSDTYDEFFWNVNGTQWQQPTTTASATILLPPTLANSLDTSKEPACFTGAYGSTDKNCAITKSITAEGATQFYAVTTSPLAAGQNLSFAIAFKAGTFAVPKIPLWKKIEPFVATGIGIAIIAGTLLFCINRWRKFGKDPKGRGSIVAEYQPPKEGTVLQHEFILHEAGRPVAITAQIVNLAIRGYLRIIDTEKDQLIGSRHEFSVELLKQPTGLTDYELQVVNMLFGKTPTAGATVAINSLKNKLADDSKKLWDSISKTSVADGLFATDPKKVIGRYMAYGSGLLALGFGALFILPGIFSVMVGLGTIVSGIIIFITARFMPARTQKGVELNDYLQGLKLYISIAEKDRIAFHQGVNTADRTPIDLNNPAQKVALFEQLLPYAMLFGLEKDWGKEFADIYNTPPAWYGGTMNNFTTGYLLGSLGDFNSVTVGSFSPPPSSGGSGFGGGGFSGGGGGGGGGGGW